MELTAWLPNPAGHIRCQIRGGLFRLISLLSTCLPGEQVALNQVAAQNLQTVMVNRQLQKSGGVDIGLIARIGILRAIAYFVGL